MNRRTILVAMALAAAAAAARRAAQRLADDGHRAGATRAVHAGWHTCSAPSAAWYDLAAGRVLSGLYRRMADDLAGGLAGVVAASTSRAEPHVLEIGPGPGHLAIELARRVTGLRVTGLDIDPVMVELASARAAREGVSGRVTFVVGDVGALPFPDASFDLVTSSFSAHHWPNGTAAFAELWRVLRPGGRAIVFDLPDRWGRFERRARPLAAAAAAGGFSGARALPYRWPGRMSVVQRLEVTRPDDARPAEA